MAYDILYHLLWLLKEIIDTNIINKFLVIC